jgi:hypothetical protein
LGVKRWVVCVLVVAAAGCGALLGGDEDAPAVANDADASVANDGATAPDADGGTAIGESDASVALGIRCGDAGSCGNDEHCCWLDQSGTGRCIALATACTVDEIDLRCDLGVGCDGGTCCIGYFTFTVPAQPIGTSCACFGPENNTYYPMCTASAECGSDTCNDAGGFPPGYSGCGVPSIQAN